MTRVSVLILLWAVLLGATYTIQPGRSFRTVVVDSKEYYQDTTEAIPVGDRIWFEGEGGKPVFVLYFHLTGDVDSVTVFPLTSDDKANWTREGGFTIGKGPYLQFTFLSQDFIRLVFLKNNNKACKLSFSYQTSETRAGTPPWYQSLLTTDKMKKGR